MTCPARIVAPKKNPFEGKADEVVLAILRNTKKADLHALGSVDRGFRRLAGDEVLLASKLDRRALQDMGAREQLQAEGRLAHAAPPRSVRTLLAGLGSANQEIVYSADAQRACMQDFGARFTFFQPNALDGAVEHRVLHVDGAPPGAPFGTPSFLGHDLLVPRREGLSVHTPDGGGRFLSVDELGFPGARLFNLAVSPDEARIALVLSHPNGNSVQLLSSLEDRTPVQIPLPDSTGRLAFASDGRRLGVVGNSRVHVFDITADAAEPKAVLEGGTYNSIAFSEDGAHALTRYDGGAHVHDLEKGTRVELADTHHATFAGFDRIVASHVPKPAFLHFGDTLVSFDFQGNERHEENAVGRLAVVAGHGVQLLTYGKEEGRVSLRAVEYGPRRFQREADRSGL